MQKLYSMSKIVLIFLLVMGNDQCSFAQSNLNTRSEEKSECQSKVEGQVSLYKILKTTCTKTDSCYVITYVDSKYFNKDDLPKVTEGLSKEFEKKRGLTVWLFDDLDLAESFASGKREYVNIASDTRGKYVRGGNEEFLIFSPRKKRLGDLSDVIVINLKKDKPI